MRGEGRFFLDTADTAEWDALLPLGIFHGVTTNPTLLERAGHPCTVFHIHELATRALAQTSEFMCQAWGDTADELYATGMALSDPNRHDIVIKVPVTAKGTEAAGRLIQSGVRVCLTACYSSHQALIASGVGAEYLAPYLGRMNDAGIGWVERVHENARHCRWYGKRYTDSGSKYKRCQEHVWACGGWHGNLHFLSTSCSNNV